MEFVLGGKTDSYDVVVRHPTFWCVAIDPSPSDTAHRMSHAASLVIVAAPS
jgi:hypothetical protein